MEKKTFKEFVKEHKKEIALGTLAVVGTVVGVVVFRKSVATRNGEADSLLKAVNEEIEKVKYPRKLPMPKLTAGVVEDAVGYENAVELWGDDIPIANLGKFGEDVLEWAKEHDLTFVDENSEAWILTCIRPPRNSN